MRCWLLFNVDWGFHGLHFSLYRGFVLTYGGELLQLLRCGHLSSKQHTIKLLDLLCGDLLGFSGPHGLHELHWGLLFYYDGGHLDLYFELLLGHLLCCGGEWLHNLCFWYLPGLDCTVELHTLRGWYFRIKLRLDKLYQLHEWLLFKRECFELHFLVDRLFFGDILIIWLFNLLRLPRRYFSGLTRIDFLHDMYCWIVLRHDRIVSSDWYLCRWKVFSCFCDCLLVMPCQYLHFICIFIDLFELCRRKFHCIDGLKHVPINVFFFASSND